MLKFGNKEFRNLQEQVEENMKDIESLKSGQAVLDEFGIKVIGEVASIDDMPTVAEYKEENPDWEYGDTYAVGTQPPYTMYILTRANGTHETDYWFNIGVFPEPGPQGEQGPQGPEGPQGQTGNTGPTGASAGFGTPTASVTQYSRGTQPTVSVEASGPDTEKVFSFEFGIPSGAPSVTLTSTSGTLTLSQFNMLQDQPDSVILQRVSAGSAIVFYTLQRWKKTEDYMYFICLYNYTPNRTSFRICQVDLHNRKYTLTSDVAMKVGKYNISSYDPDISGNVTAGKVLTADGSGGASWEDLGGSGLEVVTLTQSVSTLSDDDYNKLNGDNAIIKFVSSADGYTKYFKKYKDDGTYIYYYQVSQEDGSGTFFGGFRIVKSTKYCASLNSYLTVTSSNIKSGSTIANQYLTSNGSGGTSWTSGPSFTQQQADWNESSQSSPAYIKNKPTIPTKTSDLTNDSGFITGITSSDVTTALGYTPYDSSNPNGYTSNVGTVTSVNNVSPVNGDVTIAIPTVPTNVSDFNNDAGYLTSSTGVTSVNGNSGAITNIATLSDLPDAVSGTNDGTNWTTITIGSTTKNIPSGGGTPSNMVTTDTAQTITGNKTLTGTTTFNGNTTFSSGITLSNGSQIYMNGPLGDNCGVISCSGSATSANSSIGIIGQDKIEFKHDGSLYSLVVPNTNYFSSDKIIATTDDIPTITINTTSGSESVSDGTNTLSFGSNAFNSTSIPSVSGTNDGINWTTLTIDSVTKNIPAGGSGSGVSDVTIDGTSIVSNNVAAMTTETWTFTLANGNTVTKKVVLG